jgi:hypothetical protein
VKEDKILAAPIDIKIEKCKPMDLLPTSSFQDEE